MNGLRNWLFKRLFRADDASKQVAALKRMLLQIKTSKVCARTEEGGVGIRIFIFLSGKLLYFFLGLCYYSDKFLSSMWSATSVIESGLE